MGCGVDPQGASGDDDDASGGEGLAEVAGTIEVFTIGRARSDDGDDACTTWGLCSAAEEHRRGMREASEGLRVGEVIEKEGSCLEIGQALREARHAPEEFARASGACPAGIALAFFFPRLVEPGVEIEGPGEGSLLAWSEGEGEAQGETA